MPAAKLATDVIKEQLSEWIYDALKCEMQPEAGDSIANRPLPDVKNLGFRARCRSESDETNAITLTTAHGKKIKILVVLGD